MSASLQFNGQGSRYRFHAGVSGVDTENLQSGGGNEQANTSYASRGGHAQVNYSPSDEKTLSLSYRAFEKNDTPMLSYLNLGFLSDAVVDPMRMQMSTLRYNDVTNRRWADSLTATTSWNRQVDGRDYTVNSTRAHVYNKNSSNMLGLNVEVGKFIRSHHLIYGLDRTQEKIHSEMRSLAATGVTTAIRGDYLNGGEYEATGVYVNDRFPVTKWLTVTGGLRYGRYTSRGQEVLPVLGAFDGRSTKSNVTTSLNAVFHATPTLNLVGNYVSGYRAPNMHDMTQYSLNSLALVVPSTNVEAERMRSIEAGAKYDSGRLSGSIFGFRNNLSNLLIQAPGLLNGQSFVDLNRNGVRNLGEPAVIVTRNVGVSTIKGFELDARYIATPNVTLWGNYTRTIGTNNDSRQTLSRIQPRLANTGARFAAMSGYRLWTEAILTYGSAYLGADGQKYPGFHVYTVRGGARFGERVALTVAVENVLDERYRYAPNIALVDQPGRQLVIATDFKF